MTSARTLHNSRIEPQLAGLGVTDAPGQDVSGIINCPSMDVLALMVPASRADRGTITGARRFCVITLAQWMAALSPKDSPWPELRS